MLRITAAEATRRMIMQMKSMQLGMVGTNCYIFWDESTKKCAVVDPGDKGELVAQWITAQGLEPVAVLLTHSHFDHILGIPGLRRTWPDLPVYCHPADINPTDTVRIFGTTFPSVTSFGNVLPYVEGDRVSVGDLSVEVISTPGHTPGSVTLRCGDVLFTGDTLFRSSVGRTDLEGGDFGKLLTSLKKLGSLAGDYRVLPGHESASTLAEERCYNGYLTQAMQM